MSEFKANNTVGFILQTMLYLSNHTPSTTVFKELSNVAQQNNPVLTDAVCYGVYGCFSIAAPWSGNIERPITYFPESPTKMNVKFALFNKHNQENPRFVDLNDPENVKNFKISKWAPLFFVAHGYLESGDRPWLRDFVRALLKRERDSTVVVVDWRGGSSPPYAQAASNIRVVGAMTAHVIHLIYEECKLPNLNKVHMIGHSLGSHLSGYAGYHLYNDFSLTLGRISGLDPAEPLFSGTDPIVRLETSDARFVDIVHTDARPFIAGGLGMLEPIGHVDFYPNGGSLQPGCTRGMTQMIEEKGSFFWGLQEFLGCDHIRSYQLFLQTIESKSGLLKGITCGSYEEFLQGDCFSCTDGNHHCLKFGYMAEHSYRNLFALKKHFSSEPIKAYLMTAGAQPYVRNHYKVTVVVSTREESLMHGGEIGMLKLTIYGKNETLKTDKMNFSKEPRLFEPGYRNSSVIVGEDVGVPQYAVLDWDYRQNPLNPLTWRILATPRIYLDYIIIESLNENTLVKLCPILREPVTAGAEHYFKAEGCPDESK